MLKAYHGTNTRFSEFNVDYARVKNDFYGGQIYFTDNIGIAKSYARNAAKREGIPFVYEVNLKLKNIFDVDKVFVGEDLKKILKEVRNLDEFARSAKLLKLGDDKFEVMSSLKQGNTPLTGDQIFRGISKGMVQTADARNLLSRLGYDALRYNGGNMGIQTAVKHNVYIPYNSSSIEILNRYIVKTDKVNDSKPYTFI